MQIIEHEAQVLAIEYSILLTLSVAGTQKLIFPDNARDRIHFTRCSIHSKHLSLNS